MWGWHQRPISDDFPKGFRRQRIGVAAVEAIAELPHPEIARYFREHPETAYDLLFESGDKRYSPSSFIKQESSGFSVGWISSRPFGYHAVKQFSNLADAATDYLLFSLGKGRWIPPDTAEIPETQPDLAQIYKMRTTGASGFLANYARISDDIGRTPFWKPLGIYFGSILLLPFGLLIFLLMTPIRFLIGTGWKDRR
jgi:hypothetical protein